MNDKRKEDFKKWLTEKAENNKFNEIMENAKNLKICTHVSKYTEPYGAQVRVLDIGTKIDNSNIVCTSNVKHINDIAATDGGDNLSVIALYNYLNTDDKEYIEILYKTVGKDTADKLLEAIKPEEAPMPNKTDRFIKQVYFPVGSDDEYHLLSVLPSTSLLNEVNDRIWKKIRELGKHSIRLSLMSSNIINNTASRIVIKKASKPKLFLSLPPSILTAESVAKRRKEVSAKNLPPFSIDDLEGVVDGMCISNETLHYISGVGITHAGNYCYVEERSEEVKVEFLNKYGYESQPEGYELHHIIPLSQGGEDSADNMILLSEADHQLITSEHQKYFKWRRG